MFVHRVTGGVLATNCYLVAGDGAPEAMVIDPGLSDAACDRLLHLLATRGLTLRYVVNTHGHPDHTRGNTPLRRATRAALLAHRADLPFLREPWAFLTAMTTRHAVPCPRCGTTLTPASTDLVVEADRGRATLRCVPCAFTLHGVAASPDHFLQDGDRVQVGDLTARVFHTPGHSPGSIALHIPRARAIFAGDLWLHHAPGPTDLPGASRTAIVDSLTRIVGLPDATTVHPGHGATTSIGNVRRRLGA
jgi:glyoxylase-like metal-dependent hydrolase (beta-lactamase superfamily II)